MAPSCAPLAGADQRMRAASAVQVCLQECAYFRSASYPDTQCRTACGCVYKINAGERQPDAASRFISGAKVRLRSYLLFSVVTSSVSCGRVYVCVGKSQPEATPHLIWWFRLFFVSILTSMGVTYHLRSWLGAVQHARVAALEKANRDLGWQVAMLARGSSNGPAAPHRAPLESPGPASEGAGASTGLQLLVCTWVSSVALLEVKHFGVPDGSDGHSSCPSHDAAGRCPAAAMNGCSFVCSLFLPVRSL